MAERPVRYAPAASCAFATEVRRDVAQYFAAHGLSDKADARVWVRGVLMLVLVFAPYTLLLSLGLTGWAGLGLCVLMGMGVAGVGFTLAHDGQHASMSSRPLVNRLAGLTFDLLGVSGYFWRMTHNRIHHMFTNMPGLDEDIEATPLVRTSPGRPRHFWHRFQHFFAFPLYGLLTLSWVLLKDYSYLLRRRLGPFEGVRHPRGLWVGVLAGKLLYYGWTIVVPLLVLRPSLGAFLLGTLAMHMTAGIILGVVFQLAHQVEGAEYPLPAFHARQADSWAVHQMRTTSDFARGNRFLGWYLGGLNFQIEHHLFPHICSIHYAGMSPVVEACARRNGVPYHVAPGFWSAVGSHVRRLKALGAPTRSTVA